jgi:glycosyltransferase involved in cell wall biosynthesis
MRETLSVSDVLLMPSTSEGNPVSVIEALKQGVAVVGSTTPGLSDLIDDGGNGYAVSIESPEPFIGKLHHLAGDRTLLYAMKSRSLQMSAMFDIDTIAEKFEALLRKVSRGR